MAGAESREAQKVAALNTRQSVLERRRSNNCHAISPIAIRYAPCALPGGTIKHAGTTGMTASAIAFGLEVPCGNFVAVALDQ